MDELKTLQVELELKEVEIAELRMESKTKSNFYFAVVCAILIVCVATDLIVKHSLETYKTIQTTAMQNGLIESAIPGSKVIIWVKPDAK